MSNRDAYVQKLKAKMDEWNDEIDKLAAKADQAEAESRIEYEKRLEELRAKRKDVEDKIAEVQQAGESAWEDLKEGLENSWEILKASFTKAKSRFEQGYKEGREEE
jgi:DNA-binding transcriptional MerR regulator